MKRFMKIHSVLSSSVLGTVGSVRIKNMASGDYYNSSSKNFSYWLFRLLFQGLCFLCNVCHNTYWIIWEVTAPMMALPQEVQQARNSSWLSSVLPQLPTQTPSFSIFLHIPTVPLLQRPLLCSFFGLFCLPPPSKAGDVEMKKGRSWNVL